MVAYASDRLGGLATSDPKPPNDVSSDINKVLDCIHPFLRETAGGSLAIPGVTRDT
jgi:hypothetical protein